MSSPSVAEASKISSVGWVSSSMMVPVAVKSSRDAVDVHQVADRDREGLVALVEVVVIRVNGDAGDVAP